jgi:hypothetical protein
MTGISECDRSKLADLGSHWGEAYVLGFDGDTWSASPFTDPAVILTADTADDLRLRIRDDYGRNDRRPDRPGPFAMPDDDTEQPG